MLMLDDLKYIHQRDAQDALGTAEKQWQQYQHIFNFKWQPPREIHNIVLVGMGGSGLAGRVFQSWHNLPVPFEAIQDYDLPAYINHDSLIICSSHSGNTEEVVQTLKKIVGWGAKSQLMAIVITSGGQELEIAEKHNLPLIKLPHGHQPRYDFGFELRALVEILEALGFLNGVIKQLNEAGELVKKSVGNWRPDTATKKNEAKQIAQELMGRSVIVYSGPLLSSAAYKWKISINENAKQLAWAGQLPEFNHNEMLGWTEQPVQKPFSVVELRSKLENPRTQKRFEVTERLLSGRRPQSIIVEAQGHNLLQQLLYCIALGDFVSIYLALLNGLNPTSVDLIEKFKKTLAE